MCRLQSSRAWTFAAKVAGGVLADVLRGELPSFARAADSQDSSESESR